MNKAYEWLKEWMRGGGWSGDSLAGSWSLHLNFARTFSDGGSCFRDDMAKLLEAAEIGFKLIELNKSDVSSIEYENRLGKILEMANEQNVSTTERASS